MSGFEGDSTSLANSMYNSLDTRRNDGLQHTSLNVLNVKKGHRTQIQKQFQQFNKQQQYQQQQRQQHQDSLNSNGLIGSRIGIGSKSSLSFHSQSSLQHPRNSFDFIPPVYKQSMNGSTTSFHSNNQAVVPQGQWFSGNDLNNDNSEDFDGFSSYTVSPEVNDHSEWNSHYRRVQELEAENQVLMEEINKFQEFKELNEVLIEESDILREKLAILKENTEYANTNRDGDLIKLQQLNKEQEQKIDDHAKEKESFELKLEAMTQEITKLKLIHIESNRAKTKQIETLKEENEELLKELEVYYQKGTSSALTSLESTPKSSPMEYNYNSASTQETPPEVHQKTFQQGTLPYNNEELVADLLITIRQLKSENEMLVEQKENISSNLVRQKKFVKKFASGNRSNNKVKVRKGLSIVESIDVLI